MKSKRTVTEIINPVGAAIVTGMERREMGVLKDRLVLELVEELRREGLHPPRQTGQRRMDVGLKRYWETYCEKWVIRYPDMEAYKSWNGALYRYNAARDRHPEPPIYWNSDLPLEDRLEIGAALATAAKDLEIRNRQRS